MNGWKLAWEIVLLVFFQIGAYGWFLEIIDTLKGD